MPLMFACEALAMKPKSPQQTVSACIRWTARVLSAALFALFATLLLGEGPPPLWPFSITTLLFCFLATAFTALVVAWRWELAGSLIALAGVAGFYLVEWAQSDFNRVPSGWVMPLVALTGMLYLLAANLLSAVAESLRDSHSR